MSIPPPLPPGFHRPYPSSPYPTSAASPFGGSIMIPQRPPYSRRTILIIAASTVLGLVLAGGIGFFAHRTYTRNQPLPYVLETPAARFAATGPIFNGPRLPSTREQAIARNVIDAVSSAIAKKDNAALLNLIDVDRFVLELERRGAIPSLESQQHKTYVKSVTPYIPAMYTNRADNLSWTHYDVLQARMEGNAEMVIYQRAWAKGGYPVRCRWWLRRGTGGAWRVFDLEETSATDRLSEWYGVTASAAYNGTSPAWSGKFYNVNNASQKSIEGDFEKADQNLAIVDAITFPPLLEAIRHKVRAEIRIGQGRIDDALKECEAARAIRDDIPDTLKVLTRAYSKGRKYDEAARSAQEYIARVGPDDDINDLLGEALLQLKRKDEALAAFRAGVSIDRESGLCVAGLASTLGSNGASELNASLAASPDPSDRFRIAANHAINRRDGKALATLVEAYRPLASSPGEPRLLYYDGEAQLLLEQYAKAAGLLKRALAVAAPASEALYHDEMLIAYENADLPLEGYAASPHPDVAFQRFADVIRYRDKDGKRMHQLVDAHRAVSPNDLMLNYYEAAAFGMDKEHEKELASYEKGIRAAASLDPKMLQRYQYGRTNAAFTLGDGLRAYDDTLPVITFDSLAPRYFEGKDANGLEKLLAAHRAKFPADAALPTWNAALAFLKGDYAQTIKLVRAQPAASTPKNERADFQQWRRHDMLVRSLVRLKRIDEAERVVNDVKEDEKPDPSEQALIDAVRGKATDVQALLSHLLEDDEDYGIKEFLDDPDLGPILKTAPYAAWRAKQIAATQAATTRPGGEGDGDER